MAFVFGIGDFSFVPCCLRLERRVLERFFQREIVFFVWDSFRVGGLLGGCGSWGEASGDCLLLLLLLLLL